MQQGNLWAASARTTGFSCVFEQLLDSDGDAGRLSVYPTWSKQPSHDRGIWMETLVGDDLDYMPELMGSIYHAWHTTQPHRSLPRTLNNELKRMRALERLRSHL